MSTPQYKAPPPQHRGEEHPPDRIDALSIAAFVSSFLIGMTGIILGLIALNQIKNKGERGRGLAIAALVIGCAYMVIFAYLTIALFSSDGRKA
jgi:peptidyl-prolyl cis-trans isomerase B (cyclophilin B)